LIHCLKVMIYVTRPTMPDINEFIGYTKKIWQNRWLTNHGEFVNLLEKKLKHYLAVADLLCVTNGTIALQIALKLYDFKPGSEIITTPFSFIATTNAILNEKLRPVFADIDGGTFNLDPRQVEKKIAPNTKAILATHVYGNPSDVVGLQRIANKYHLKVIYDAAHAFGVQYKSQSILNFGDVSTLSFHATKVFNTIEGGALVVRNAALSKKIKLLRDFGIVSEEKNILAGLNGKMNEFQAIMGLCNLDSIDQIIKERKSIYEHYVEGLANSKVKFQSITASRYNYSYMPVCFVNKHKRDKVCNALLRHGIMARKYFYPLITDFNYVKYFVRRNELKNAVLAADTVLCLPLYPDLNLGTVDRIIRIVKNNI